MSETLRQLRFGLGAQISQAGVGIVCATIVFSSNLGELPPVLRALSLGVGVVMALIAPTLLLEAFWARRERGVQVAVGVRDSNGGGNE